MAFKDMDGVLEWTPFQAAYDSTASARQVIFQALRAQYPKQQTPTLPQEEQPAPTQTPERRRSQPLVGVTDWTPDNQHLPEWAKVEILSAVNLADDQGAAFLVEIEDAFSRALLRPEFQTKRSEIKNSLMDVETAAAKLVEALDNVPIAGQRYIRKGGILFSQFYHQARAQFLAATRAAALANGELSGRGDDKDNTPAILAAEIAVELKRIGIEPVANRPTHNNHTPSPFYRMVQTCLKAAGMAYKDPYPYMRDGLLLVKIENLPNSDLSDTE